MTNEGGVTKETSLANKTGSWRTFKPVVTEKCTGCGTCVMYCPESCIKLVKGEKFPKKAEINYDYCKGCLICATECPFKAIEKEKEK